MQTWLAQSVGAAHAAPGAHDGHCAPPQSTSDSLPFRMPSLHDAATHVIALPHELLAQSAATAHARPSAHAGHAGPPQSTSVSPPSRVVFAHVAGEAHRFVVSQRLWRQSRSTPHTLPAAHPRAHDPPQSTSVSSPLRAPSKQLADAHAPPAHTLDAQSTARRHVFPFPHGSGQAPPQSTSLSLPSTSPSRQDGVTHRDGAPMHPPPVQSTELRHSDPSKHGTHAAPPQSTSDSAPSRTPFLQASTAASPPVPASSLGVAGALVVPHARTNASAHAAIADDARECINAL